MQEVTGRRGRPLISTDPVEDLGCADDPLMSS